MQQTNLLPDAQFHYPQLAWLSLRYQRRNCYGRRAYQFAIWLNQEVAEQAFIGTGGITG